MTYIELGKKYRELIYKSLEATLAGRLEEAEKYEEEIAVVFEQMKKAMPL